MSGPVAPPLSRGRHGAVAGTALLLFAGGPPAAGTCLAQESAASVAQESAASVAQGSAAARQDDPFPHGDHRRLFPVCTGCHEGAESGVAAEMHPDPALCVECHDGRELELVFWRGPTPRPTSLRYDHALHAREVRAEGGRDEPLACAHCHVPPGSPRMTVERAVEEQCFDCHAHRTRDHYADAACSTCHLPLSESGLSGSRIAGLPVPSTHERSDFLARLHGERARAGPESCSACHTRERCTSCHVDPGAVAVIGTMPRAPAGMELPAFAARYFTPESHGRDAFLETHGRELEPAACSTCHTRESCTTCHVDAGTPALTRLPAVSEVRAPGASVERREPASHESPFFVEDHEALAAGGGSCTACHTESSCAECHGETSEPGYHPPNFALRHSSQSYGTTMECANCHDNSVFCRDCHAQLGMQPSGRRGGGFHDRKPAWLLRHGQAARQALESCASCHRQRDCLQCHSELGAFQVSPHGPGFDARRVFDRNPQICFACHISNPVGRSQP